MLIVRLVEMCTKFVHNIHLDKIRSLSSGILLFHSCLGSCFNSQITFSGIILCDEFRVLHDMHTNVER